MLFILTLARWDWKVLRLNAKLSNLIFFSTENVSETIFGWNVSQKIALIAKIFDVAEVFANSKVNYSKIAQKTGQD